MAKNYFDKNGNYINVENLSLADIYHRAFALGVESTPIRDERKKGEWISDWRDDLDAMSKRGWKCSCCSWRTSYGTPRFCMNCGAEMKDGK